MITALSLGERVSGDGAFSAVAGRVTGGELRSLKRERMDEHEVHTLAPALTPQTAADLEKQVCATVLGLATALVISLAVTRVKAPAPIKKHHR